MNLVNLMAFCSMVAAAPPTVVAVVNGESITLPELNAAMSQRPPIVTPLSAAQQKAIQQEALATLIDDLLIRQFLKKQVPETSKEEVDKQVAKLQRALAAQGKPLDEYLKETRQTEAQLRGSIIAMLQWNAYSAKKITEADLRKNFNDFKDYFDHTTVRVSHIVSRISPESSPADRDTARQKLAALRQEILGQKISFAEAAAKHSHCPSAAKGGDLGFITRKWMVDEPFARAAFSMKVGEMSDVIATEFGLHLIVVTERKPGTPVQFEQVADEVRESVMDELRQDTLQELRRTAKVEVKLP